MAGKKMIKPSRLVLSGAIATITAISNQHSIAADQKLLTIEEVVVTAQKRAQSMQDVPISVSALSADTIKDAGINNISDISILVPSLEVQSNAQPFTASYKIRRIGNEGNIVNFEPSTGLFIDGAFRSRSGMGLSDLVDIERIEVLKGPQSTLYGKNVTAGVISVVTKLPSDEFEAEAELSGGSENYRHAKGMISGSLSENTSGRLSASYRKRDGIMDLIGPNGKKQDANDIDQYAVRGQLLYTPNESFSARLIAGAVERDMLATEPDVSFNAAGLAIFGPVVSDNKIDNYRADLNYPTRFDMDGHEAIAILEYDFGSFDLTSTSSWDRYQFMRSSDTDQTTLDVVDSMNDGQEGTSFSQELRLASNEADDLGWIIGAFYYRNKLQRGNQGPSFFILGSQAPLLGLAPPGVARTEGDLDSLSESENYSAFGQINWQLSESIAINGGLRWSYEEKDVEIKKTVDYSTPSLITNVLLPVSLGGTLDRDTDQITGNLNAQYFFLEDQMAYASIARGFKSGGFNAGWGSTPMDQREFSDETVDSYELGIKSTLLDGRMQINAAAFYQEYKDFQAASFVSLQFIVNNAEEAVAKGLEFDGTILLSQNWTATFGISYVEAEYEKFSNGTCYPGRPVDNPANQTCNLSGQKLPYAPDLKASLGIQYEQPLFHGDLYVHANASWTDDYLSNTNMDPTLVQDSYALLNTRIGWRNYRYDISLWFNNVTDETYFVQTGAYNLGAGLGTQAFLNDPFTFGLTARVNF